MLTWFRSALTAAAVALLLPVKAVAQGGLPPDTPGVLADEDFVLSLLDAATTDERLMAVLRGLDLCVSDPDLAGVLRRAGVAAIVLPQSAAGPATRSGECDLFIAGQAAERLSRIVTGGDDVAAARDTEGPAIRAETLHTGTSGSVEILVGIDDPSGVARVDADGWQGVRRIAQRSGQIYGVAYALPPHYRPEPLVVRAVDELGNESEVLLTLRRLPACGDPEGVTREIVTRIQEDLNAIGREAGPVDGFAAETTCRALAEHGLTGVFDWGDVAYGLARDRIGLSVPAEVETAIGRALITVTVADPRDTRAVSRIRMLRGGLVATNRTVRDGAAEFEVNLPPGARETVEFEALDTRGQVLAAASAQVVRAAQIGLRISGRDLVGDHLSTPESQVELQAEMTGLSHGAIAYRGPGGQEERTEFLGAPISFVVKMPEPGQGATLAFVAIGPDRETRATQEIALFREPVHLSVSPSQALELDAGIGELTVLVTGAHSGTRLELRDSDGAVLDRGEHVEGRAWIARAPMPPAGEQAEVVVIALDRVGEGLGAPQRVTLIRPGPALPRWLLPGMAGLVLLAGIAGGALSILRKRRGRAA